MKIFNLCGGAPPVVPNERLFVKQSTKSSAARRDRGCQLIIDNFVWLRVYSSESFDPALFVNPRYIAEVIYDSYEAFHHVPIRGIIFRRQSPFNKRRQISALWNRAMFVGFYSFVLALYFMHCRKTFGKLATGDIEIPGVGTLIKSV